MPTLNPICFSHTEGVNVSAAKTVLSGAVAVLEDLKRFTGGRIAAELKNFGNKPIGTGSFGRLDDYIIAATNEEGIVDYNKLLETLHNNPLQDITSEKVMTVLNHNDLLLIDSPIEGGPRPWGGYDGGDKMIVSIDGINKENFPETKDRLMALRYISAREIGHLLGLDCPNQKLPCTMQDIEGITLQILLKNFSRTGLVFCPSCQRQMAEMINNYKDHPRIFQI